MANRRTLENLLAGSALVACSLILSGSAKAQVVTALPPYTMRRGNDIFTNIFASNRFKKRNGRASSSRVSR